MKPNMTYKSMCVFADGDVGLKAVEHLAERYAEVLKAVVVVGDDSEVVHYLVQKRYPRERIFRNETLYTQDTLSSLMSMNLDFILLAWWPKIIKKQVLSIPRVGVLNFHPSLLPYNRGKHYNFWTIVEESPFGVSLHFVSEAIDAGDIVFQRPIEKTWEDTGGSLYQKAREAMLQLFVEKLPELLAGNFSRMPQDLAKGSFHLSTEIGPASEIRLGEKYAARRLLNLIRARTFPGKPSCYFFDKGKKYSVTISIKEDK